MIPRPIEKHLTTLLFRVQSDNTNYIEFKSAFVCNIGLLISFRASNFWDLLMINKTSAGSELQMWPKNILNECFLLWEAITVTEKK